MEKSLGLAPGQFAPSAKDVSVRACALNAIGLLRTAEGNAFLARLGPGDFDSAAVYQLLPIAKTSLLQGKLTQASSQSEKRVLLEAALVEVQDPIVLSRFRIWAMNAMCDLGLSASLPAIRSELKEWFSGERAEEELRFCEARVQVVGSSPDRARALGSVLNSRNTTRSNRLMVWAISELDQMNTDEARRELRRYLTESAMRSGGSNTQQEALYRKLVEEALERTRVGAPLK